MAGCRQETLYAISRNNQCAGVDQRVELKGFRSPEVFIDDDVNVMLGIVDDGQQRDRSRFDAQMFFQPTGGSEGDAAARKHTGHGLHVDPTVAWYHHQKVPVVFTVAQKKVLGLDTRQIGCQAMHIGYGKDRWMVEALVVDAHFRQELEYVFHLFFVVFKKRSADIAVYNWRRCLSSSTMACVHLVHLLRDYAANVNAAPPHGFAVFGGRRDAT